MARQAARDQERWDAVRERRDDPSFVYAVRSTGIYCRSCCASRLPLTKNVEFFETSIAAELAGYRACKRCRPDEPPRLDRATRAVVNMCRMIEDGGSEPTLSELASHAELSRSHAHRQFRRITGLTPKAYANALTRRRVESKLGEHASVTQTVYASGFCASSRFYERVGRLLGMSARQYQSGGSGLAIRFAVGQCSLGAFLVAATERGVCAVYLGDEPGALVVDLETRFPTAELLGGDQAFETTVAEVVTLLETQAGNAQATLPLDIQGTVFQERVYQALRRVPPGETVTYSELARRIGLPKAARAVARACAMNDLAVLVPCHRVIRTDGSLSGYRWGVERKRALLLRERAGRPRAPVSGR